MANVFVPALAATLRAAIGLGCCVLQWRSRVARQPLAARSWTAVLWCVLQGRCTSHCHSEDKGLDDGLRRTGSTSRASRAAAACCWLAGRQPARARAAVVRRSVVLVHTAAPLFLRTRPEWSLVARGTLLPGPRSVDEPRRPVLAVLTLLSPVAYARVTIVHMQRTGDPCKQRDCSCRSLRQGCPGVFLTTAALVWYK